MVTSKSRVWVSFFWVCPWPRPGMQSISTKSLLTKYYNDHTVFQKCRARAGLWHGPLLGRFKMVYCLLSLRIIGSIYINHFETPARHASKARRAGPLIYTMWGLPWREVSGISYDHYIISQLNSTYSYLLGQVWARGIIKKKIPIPRNKPKNQ